MVEHHTPTHIVAKRGTHRHAEPFDTTKLHKSIIAACLSAGTPTGHAESISRRVVDEVLAWLDGRPEITSDDIRRVAAKALRTYPPDASFLYEHHRKMI